MKQTRKMISKIKIPTNVVWMFNNRDTTGVITRPTKNEMRAFFQDNTLVQVKLLNQDSSLFLK